MVTDIAALNTDILPQSVVTRFGVQYALMRRNGQLWLTIFAPAGSPVLADFSGDFSEAGSSTLLICPATTENAAALRSHLPWLNPSTLGLHTSAGMGDRMGLATPGHIRAVRATGNRVAPIFAQQSIRELTRTERTPQMVMDDALWGILAENWQGGFGADADHLKTTDDIDLCLMAGFTFFTFDPGAYVDNRAEAASPADLARLAEQLPSEVSPSRSGLSGRVIDIEGTSLHFTEDNLLRAAVKYGRAVSHVAHLYYHLVRAAGSRPFEVEVSVDETDQPTSHVEHVYIAAMLNNLGVRWVSLAPRYIGRFEKGVDYIGDPAAFEQDIAVHAAIAREMGPYKLSLHSGSDKFSIYEAAMRQTRGLVHLKTAGTSYLEALRTVAAIDPDLFRAIYVFSRDHYEADRASYHVSAELSRAPLPDTAGDLPALLDQFDARQILHICFGSVLTATQNGAPLFRDRLFDLLGSHSDAYAGNLEKHFIRHLQPFSVVGRI